MVSIVSFMSPKTAESFTVRKKGLIIHIDHSLVVFPFTNMKIFNGIFRFQNKDTLRYYTLREHSQFN